MTNNKKSITKCHQRHDHYMMRQNKHHLMPRDPLDAITLYTKVDAECDKQVTVVNSLLTTLTHIHQCQQQTYDCRLFIALGDNGHSAAKFSKSSLGQSCREIKKSLFWKIP